MRPLLRPRWLIVHVLVLAIAALFINLGFWQLRRLEERRADNERIAANLSAPPRALDDILAQYGNDPDELIYRRVTLSGSYLPADEVLLTPRENGRRPGHHVVTPLRLGDGNAMLIDRGWVPFVDDIPPVAEAAPPEEEVTVTGVLFPTQEAVRVGNRDGGTDRITFLSAVDVDALQPQVDTPLLPFSVLLQDQQPVGAALPIPGAAPQQSEGNHQSYAWQWFSFTAILLLGYPFLLRRSIRGPSVGERAPRSVAQVDLG